MTSQGDNGDSVEKITLILEIESSASIAQASIPIVSTFEIDCESPVDEPAIIYTPEEIIRKDLFLNDVEFVIYRYVFNEELPFRDTLLLDGAQQLALDEELPLSDEIGGHTLKERVDLDESLPFTEEFPDTAYFSERLRFADECSVKHTPPGGIFSISGTQWMPGSELPCAGATVHLIKRHSDPILVEMVDLFDELELIHRRGTSAISSETLDGETEPALPPGPPRELVKPGNVPEYMTTTDSNGFFQMEDIPGGKYVVVATKPGYSIDIQRVNLTEDVQLALLIHPVNEWGIIDRTYDELGNVVKMYLYGDVMDGEDRIVDGIVVFGDLYGTAIAPQTPMEMVPGHLSVIDRYTIGNIDIVNTPILGRIGFFETETETLDIDPDNTIVTWHAADQVGDFDGFCFRYRFHRLMTGVLTLSFFSRIVIPEPLTPDVIDPSVSPSPSADTPGSSNQPRWGHGWNTHTQSVYYRWKPKWSPYFGVGLSDGIRVREPVATKQLGPVKRIVFTETIGVSSTSITPPRLSMTGVAVSDTGEPVSGATVIVKAKRTDRVVAETVTTENGLWRVTNLESELIYDILIFEPDAPEHYASGGSVQVLDRDIVDSRALVLLEDIAYRDDGTDQYIDFRIILPPLGTRLDTDGRAYGEIIDKFTRRPIVGALVEVYPGTLDDEDLETYSGQIFAYQTFKRDYVTDGFYEVYLPPGDYSLRVTADGYADSTIYHFSIQGGGWHKVIELTRGAISGRVYDALDWSAGIRTPIAGAIIRWSDVEVITAQDGLYSIPSSAIATEDEMDIEMDAIVSCQAVDYVTSEKRVRIGDGDITTLNFLLWQTQQYHHHLLD